MLREIKFGLIGKNILAMMFAVYAVQSVWLAFDSEEYLPVYQVILMLNYRCCVFVGLVYLVWLASNNRIKVNAVYFCIIPLTYFLFQIFNNVHGFNTGWIIPFVLSCMYILFDKTMQINIFNKFYWIVMTVNVISIFMVICFIMQLDIGFEIVSYYAGAETLRYIKWGIFAIYMQPFSDGAALRLCGVFNEPGGLGTVCALLYILRYNVSQKWEKSILIITSIFTFSLAAFVLIFTWHFIKLVRNNKTYLMLIPIACILFFTLPYMDYGDESVNSFARRFQITEKGIAGNTRADIYDKAKYNDFLNNGDVFFGDGVDSESVQLGAPITMMMWIGIIGEGLYFSEWFILMYTLSKRNKEAIIFCVIFVLAAWQRYYCLMNLFGYVFLLGGLNYLVDSSELKIIMKREKC